MKKSILQIAGLTAAAFVIALGTNAFAGRTRKLVLPGYYPNALKVPKRVPETPSSGQAVVPVQTPVATNTAQPELPAVPATTSSAAEQPRVTTTTSAHTGGLKPALASSSPAPAQNVLERFPPHPDKAYVEIGGDDVAWLHARGALFLDARRSSVFEQGHIAGARSFSVWESDIDDKVNKLFEERGDPAQQEQPIVIYCSGGACEDSHMLAQKLWGIQFNNILVYKDGFPDWQSRNGAVRTGMTP
jgi:rhodanese-related sulfurtransferase